MGFLVIALVIIIFLGPIIGAFLLEQRHQRLRPSLRPFGWGYFNGLGGFVSPFFVAAQFGQADPGLARMVLLVAAAITWPLAVLTLRRHAWGFVLLTVFSLNPVLWIINFIYIDNRWSELTTGRPGRRASR
jgi:hypothetical protein